MQLSISHDFPQVAARLDALGRDLANRAQASLLNKAADQGRTVAVREIAGRYNVTASYARERVSIRRATFKQGRLEMEVQIRAGNGKKRAANVIAFAARQTKGGVTVKILRGGARQLLRDSFIGNKGRTVFARVPGTTMASRSKYAGTKHAEQLRPVQTIDVPQMFNARKVKETIVRVIQERLPAIAEREISFYVQRFGGK